MIKHTIRISQILNDLAELLGTNTFNIMVQDADENNHTIMTTADFYSNITIDHVYKSFLSVPIADSDINSFIATWRLFCTKHIDQWTRIFNDMLLQYDPTTTYKETRITVPDITTTNTISYGKTTDYTINHHNDTTTYGGTTRNTINTYEGTEHNANYSINGGSDTRAYQETNQTELSGDDTSETTTSGTNTMTIEGYRESPALTIDRDIWLHIKYDLNEMILKQFAAECLFYSY